MHKEKIIIEFYRVDKKIKLESLDFIAIYTNDSSIRNAWVRGSSPLIGLHQN